MTLSNWFLMFWFIILVALPVSTKLLRKLFKGTDFYFTCVAVYLLSIWFIYAMDPMMH